MRGWLCSASSTLPSALSLGKLLWEMALCPGMPWVKVSSKQRDLCFVPLAGAHYTASECCFSCGFPSLSWIPAKSGSTKEGKGKQVPRGRVKAQSVQDRTCAIALHLPRLWHSPSPRRGGEVPHFPSKFRKIQPQALRLRNSFLSLSVIQAAQVQGSSSTLLTRPA